MTGISGLGGHNPQMQRTLLDLAEKAGAEPELADPGPAAPRPRASATPVTVGRVPGPPAEAVILELSEEAAERLAVPQDDNVTPGRDIVTPGRDIVTPRRAGEGSTTPEAPKLEELSVDQLVAVLRRSGSDFKQALRILSNIDLGQPLPTKHVLRAMWDGAAPPPGSTAAEVPDRLYVAGLTTAQYQQLLVQLGEQAPEWFAAVRGTSGVRALMERRWFARLNTTSFAGLRLGGWGLAGAGVAIAWVVGLRTGAWW